MNNKTIIKLYKIVQGDIKRARNVPDLASAIANKQYISSLVNSKEPKDKERLELVVKSFGL